MELLEALSTRGGLRIVINSRYSLNYINNIILVNPAIEITDYPN
jgi:hypothetical protein